MMSQRRPIIAHHIAHRAGERILRLLAVLGFGLALGACSKCDVSNWLPNPPGQAPHSCHETPSPQ